MKEREFWAFLNGMLSKGRELIAAGSIDSGAPIIDDASRFMMGHSYLPKGYDKIPVEIITKMGMLLLGSSASTMTKEAILMLLAHHPSAEALHALKAFNAFPDMGLRVFAELALDECMMWNDTSEEVIYS